MHGAAQQLGKAWWGRSQTGRCATQHNRTVAAQLLAQSPRGMSYPNACSFMEGECVECCMHVVGSNQTLLGGHGTLSASSYAQPVRRHQDHALAAKPRSCPPDRPHLEHGSVRSLPSTAAQRWIRHRAQHSPHRTELPLPALPRLRAGTPTATYTLLERSGVQIEHSILPPFDPERSGTSFPGPHEKLALDMCAAAHPQLRWVCSTDRRPVLCYSFQGCRAHYQRICCE
jgi:hypothetical protein